MATWSPFAILSSALQNAFVDVLLLLVALYFSNRFYSIRYPPNLPRIRENGKTRFSLRTRLAYYTDCANLYREAYDTVSIYRVLPKRAHSDSKQYSKHGKTCLIPGLGFRNEVIVSSTSLRWITSQPEHVLSAFESFRELDQLEYHTGSETLVTDPWQGMIVRRDMNRILERLVFVLNDEIKYAFDTRFETSADDWTELNLYKTMKYIVAQGSSRFTVGLPLCRNEAYLTSSAKFADNFVLWAGVMGFLPVFLRPVLSPLAMLLNHSTIRNIKREFKPLFEQRMKLLQRSADKNGSDEPEDHLQMMLRYAQTDRPSELNFHDISLRLCMANFGSYHQTSVAITNIIFNILASDPEYNTISVLRDEISAAVQEEQAWTKSTIAKMTRTDSILRETLRLNSFGNRGLLRKVMVDDLRTEDGVLLPKGAMVSMLAHPAQSDEAIYAHPLKFDPFRFSRLRESAADGSPAHEADTAAGLTFVSTGARFLPFGHGRHACPGRFLVDFELKMIVAYLVTHYDFAFVDADHGRRPETRWMAEAMFPPTAGKIKFRRRKV
ncbi:hypothetical protein MMC27_006851 [Xylographa pallens]|nr:hypothetical protein [Xylographa pallens]